MFDLTNGLLVALEPAAARPWWFDMIPIVVIGAIMYFLLIRPEQQKRANQETLISSLTKGMNVVTSNGIHGTIHEVAENTVVLKVADKTRITFDKSAIARLVESAQ